MKNYQKDKYQALRTTSEKTLRNLAKKYGYDKLPKNINNVSYYAKRLGDFIEKQQYKTYQQDVEKRNKAKVNTKDYIKKQYKQVLKELNKLRNEMPGVKEVNMYLSRATGEFNSLAELNYLLDDFKKIAGDVTFDDIEKAAKKTYKKELKDIMPLIEEKIAPFNLKYFYDTLKYYGFTEKEIKYMTKIYNKGTYKQKDYMLGILKRYVKGKNRYKDIEEIADHGASREVLYQRMEMAMVLGVDWEGNKIE